MGIMKAIRVHETGGPEAMVLDQLDDLTPLPGQLVVRVEAAGVNYIDVYQRTGYYPAPMPVAMGMEAAGVVEAAGDDVPDRFGPGARVAWIGLPGAYATHARIPAERAVIIPEGVDTRVAAAVMLQGMTAHYLTRSTYRLDSGHTCLVHAAAGGVGLLLCQMARQAGARVIGTVSTEAKAEKARAAGADEVILYTRSDFVAETRRLTGGKGVEVVYDAVGQTTFEGSLDCLALRGMLVSYGQSSGPIAPFDPQLLSRKGSLFLSRPVLFHYVHTREELDERAGDVLGWVAAGTLEVTIDRAMPLADAAGAHRLLEGRQTVGKVLLVP
jgi:NADPH:quinone reductase